MLSLIGLLLSAKVPSRSNTMSCFTQGPQALGDRVVMRNDAELFVSRALSSSSFF